MIQRTFEANRIDDCRTLAGLDKFRRSEEYQRAKTKVVQIYITEWNEKKLSRLLKNCRSEFPDALIVGMTNYIGSFANPKKGGVIVTVMLFDESEVTPFFYEVKPWEEELAGSQLNWELERIPDVRGIQIFVGGTFIMLDEFFRESTKGFEDISIFGAKAAEEPEKPTGENSYVFFEDELHTGNCILALVYSGEELNIRTSYNLGWVPIGKKMKITKMDGPFLIERIDNEPAVEIYRKYLGLAPHQISVQNTNEFPLLVERGGLCVGRGVMGRVGGGKVQVISGLYEGDEVRFSYGNPNEIFKETYGDSRSIESFDAQGLLVVACGNRNIFLKEDEDIEINFYREVCPEFALIHGQSEILLANGAGGELNSALVTMAFREGKAAEKFAVRLDPKEKKCPNLTEEVPLVRRLLKFLEATTNELGEMAKEAQAASEAKSSFLANMSHEIRTPINSVLGLDEMILRETTEPEIAKYAADIKTAGRTLLSLINDILDSSRIESGKMEIVPVEYELSSALNDLVNMITVRAKEKNLDFIVNVDPEMPHLLCGDDTRIKQCALNILTNAVKYTREGSITFSVGYERVDENQIYLTVDVKDTGIGIKDEDMERLFSRFERIEERRNRTIEGTGLGMSIVRQLLGLMGTELEVTSVYGEGSDFSFKVLQRVVKWEPIGNFTEMYEKSLENANSYEESFHAPDGKVLVVDDTRMNLTVFTALLKDTGLKIDTADSGFQALELVKQKKYDVIFLDQRMPEMDGIETLQRMKALPENKNQETPVIMLTANAVAGAREQFLAAGFDDYLPKPINGSHLEKMLLSYLPPEKVSQSGSEGFVPNVSKKDDAAGNLEALSPEERARITALRQIPEIDYRTALKNCMKEDILLDAVHAFYASAKTGPDEIEGFRRGRDAKNYTVKVHALKSSARIIGATALSEAAAYLESCGDKADWVEIDERTPSLLTAYRALGEALAATEPGAGEAAEEDDRPLLPDDQLLGAYAGIKELVSAFDFDGAGDILSMLKTYRLPADARAKFEEISDLVTKLDRDRLLEILS